MFFVIDKISTIRTASILISCSIAFGGICQNSLPAVWAENKTASKPRTAIDAPLATARELMNHKQVEEAIPILSDLIARQPNLIEASAMRGVCYTQMEEFLRATRDFEAYFKAAKEPTPVGYHRSYGLALMQLGKYGQALQQFDIEVERGPKIWDYRFDRTQCYIALKQYDKALLEANVLVPLRPDHYRYALRAKLYFVMHNYQKSLDDWTAAIKQAPERLDYFTRRAQCYDLLGKPALAAADRKKRDDELR